MEPVAFAERNLIAANRQSGSSRTPNHRIAEIAGAQHGVITGAQLRSCGVSPSAISRRVANGTLHRIHPAVYAVGHAALSREGRWLAAVLAVGDGAALAGRAAALHWNISRFDVERIGVIAPDRRRGLRDLDVRRSAVLGADDIVVRDAIPVLQVHRLLIDISRDLTSWQIANLLHEAAFRRVLDRQRVGSAVETVRGARGLARLRRGLVMHDAGSAGTKSALEDEFLRIIVTAHLPLPDVNVVISTPGGRYRVDFVWRRRRLCIETDGRDSHARKATAIDDELRDEHLAAAGYRTERFTGHGVFRDPFAVARRLERLLQ